MGDSLGPKEWEAVLSRLAERLPPGEHRVMLIGGVAMALGYNSRRTTKDADVIMAPDVAAEVLPVAAAIADEFHLAHDWMNEKAVKANLIVPPDRPGKVVFSKYSLVLEVPPPEHMLAMKVARFAGDTDAADAKTLLELLRKTFSDVEMLWAHIGGRVPEAKRGTARHNLLLLWEQFDEST
jgi:hypothetical protein